MGKTDIALTSYLANPYIFADLFNAWLFGGRQVIDPKELRDENPVQSRPEYASAYKHVRDVIKLACWQGIELLLLGIEQQERIDYSAPVRTMQYDSADYQKKIRQKEEENRQRLGLHTGLPAFFPEDRITPVVTLILYFGEKEWEHPRCLHDLLSFPKGFEELRDHISRDAALFLAAVAKGTWLLKNIDKKKEDYNMCKALDDIYNDGKLEGITLGMEQGISRGIEQGISQGLAQGISQGLEQGISQGLAQGEDRFALLLEYLLGSARMEDLQRAVRDKTYRNVLYQECGIEM